MTVDRFAHRSAATRLSSILSRDHGVLGGGTVLKTRERHGAPQRGRNLRAASVKEGGATFAEPGNPGLVQFLRLHHLCIKHNGTCRNFIALFNLETNKQRKKNPPVSSLPSVPSQSRPVSRPFNYSAMRDAGRDRCGGCGGFEGRAGNTSWGAKPG